jgi:hypothetical protein
MPSYSSFCDYDAMTSFPKFSAELSGALGIPISEVRNVLRRQRNAGLLPSAVSARHQQATASDAARLLVGVMVMRLEGAGTSPAAVTADIKRLARLEHGAQLYIEADLILPGDFTGAVAEILTALADSRRGRAEELIGRIGLARGGGRMAGWIEIRAGADEWEDFDYAASPEDLVVITSSAPIVRQIEVRTPALQQIAGFLGRQTPRSKP